MHKYWIGSERCQAQIVLKSALVCKGSLAIPIILNLLFDLWDYVGYENDEKKMMMSIEGKLTK